MITAKDLLYKALDYDGFWNTSKRMKSANPSKVRKLQLDKLLTAFGITKKNVSAASQVPGKGSRNGALQTIYVVSGNTRSMGRIEYIKTLTAFQYFSFGEFIADADIAKYSDLTGQIVSTTKAVFPEHSKIIDTRPVNLVILFSSLYNFRLNVYHMFRYNFSNKTMGKFSIEDDYSLHLRQKFMDATNDNLAEVDEVLCMLIDPEKRTLKKDEIGYPAFDLTAIDEEWRNGLHKQNR